MSDNMRAKRALQALRAVDQKGMGRAAGGMGATATDRLADLDACTTAYRTWSPRVIPGLLQTEAYTASAIRSRTPSLDIGEIEKRVTHRCRRSASFLGRRAGLNGTFAWFLVGEAAITQPLTDLVTHADQLRQLLAIAQDYDNLILQVLPENASPAGTAEPFSIFHLDPGPVVGHLESLIGGWYTVASEDIARLHGAFSDMMRWALPPADSRTFIAGVLETCWERWERTAEHRSSSPHTPTPTTACVSPGREPDRSE